MERIVLRDVCDIIDGPHATPTKTESGPVYLGIDAMHNRRSSTAFSVVTIFRAKMTRMHWTTT